MKLKRGDVVVTRFPHASGFRGKKRPALIVQADIYNGAVAHLIVAQITSNLAPTNDPAFVLIDVSTGGQMKTSIHPARQRRGSLGCGEQAWWADLRQAPSQSGTYRTADAS